MMLRKTILAASISLAWPYVPAYRAEQSKALEQLLTAIEMDRLADDPMAMDQCMDLALFAHTATQALQTGQATDIDINNLAMISNIAMLLAECGYGAEALDDIITGQHAVRAVIARQDRTGRTGCSGPELQAIRDLVGLHDQQLHLGPTRRQMTAILAEMRRRMTEGEVMA